MGDRTLSDKAYQAVRTEVQSKGSATHVGEAREKQGLGLHEMVDPAGHGLIRRSISWKESVKGKFVLERGIAMLVESRVDTTGSMGENVEVAMRVLPTTYDLLYRSQNAVLKRYDLQMITSIFGDIQDRRKPLNRSQAEMDIEIARQMTYMNPEKDGGGNGKEDPQYGLFAGACLTAAEINKYGLKYYDFTLSDEPVGLQLEHEQLIRIFGNTVYEKVAENGHEGITSRKIPSTAQVVKDLQKNAHAFFLQVGDRTDTYKCWENLYGADRIVRMDNVEQLPQLQAVIIGLTEGVLELQKVENFLRDAEVGADDARRIKRAVAHIPIGAQRFMPNFSKIPLRGAQFKKKGDLWPIGFDQKGKSLKDDRPDEKDPKAEEKWI